MIIYRRIYAQVHEWSLPLKCGVRKVLNHIASPPYVPHIFAPLYFSRSLICSSYNLFGKAQIMMLLIMQFPQRTPLIFPSS